MIKVWTDGVEAGRLDRHSERGSTFAYLPDTPAARSLSVTMPVCFPSWNVPIGLPPIFEMNLPEGFLRERLRLAFGKATDAFDEFDLLSSSAGPRSGASAVPAPKNDYMKRRRNSAGLCRFVGDERDPFHRDAIFRDKAVPARVL
jgi:HipA-like protein